MTLPLPQLDDRRWADLVEEGRALIPVYAPGWTDHNVHDPGLTLMELLAWIAEMDVFQLDQIPARHRRKFLGVIGLRPEPPAPARTLVTLGLAAGGPQPLPEGAEFQGRDPGGQATPFRTLSSVTVVAAALETIQVGDAETARDVTARWRGGEPIALFGDDPRAGAALYLGFGAAPAIGVPLSLGFAVDDPGAAGRLASPHHSVRTTWEVRTQQGGWRALSADAGEVSDDTRAFTLVERVVLTLPVAPGAAAIGQVAEPRYYVRCRFTAGAYEAAPRAHAVAANAVFAEQAVPVSALAWSIAPTAIIEGTPPTPGTVTGLHLELDTDGAISRLAFVDDPMATFLVLEYRPSTPGQAGHLRIEAELLGRGSARPWQRVTLRQSPIIDASVRLFTLEDAGWQSWRLRDDLDASRPGDRDAVLDATLGTITFGDGEHGQVVPRGVRIIARYLATRAEDGNLAAGTLDVLADTAHNRALIPDFETVRQRLTAITNPEPAAGGTAAETLEHAEGRASMLMERPNRAVSLADFETFALTTPGVRLARAAARANRHPGLPCLTAPGIIAVLVLPFLPADRPMPSPELLRRVARHLERYRIIGTRVEVFGPTYVEVAVTGTVQACPGTSATALRERIVGAIDRFFHPLRGGLDGHGWTFGRDVYRSEVLQVIDETAGVEHVLSLELVADGRAPQCGNICLGPAGLVAAGSHRIDVVGASR